MPKVTILCIDKKIKSPFSPSVIDRNKKTITLAEYVIDISNSYCIENFSETMFTIIYKPLQVNKPRRKNKHCS